MRISVQPRLILAILAILVVVGINGCSSDYPDPNGQRLIVTKGGTGTGTVSSSPAGIDCGPTCSAVFTEPVRLDATADPGSIFVSWFDDCETGLPTGVPVAFPLIGPARCLAIFTRAPTRPLLTVNVHGPGTGVVRSDPAGVNCGATCQASFDADTLVQLFANPDPDSGFSGWGGDCIPDPDPLLWQAVTIMNVDRTCDATFTRVGTGGAAIVLHSVVPLAYHAEALVATPTPGQVIVADREAGITNDWATTIDATDPDALATTGTDQHLCEGVTALTISKQAGQPAVFGFSATTSVECGTILPPGAGARQFTFLSGTSGDAVPDPNDPDTILFTGFQTSDLGIQYVDFSPTNEYIPLTAPGDRSCPRFITTDASLSPGIAYVVGAEGEVGTSTENCNNHIGVWKVDLGTKAVTGFWAGGAKPRRPALSPTDPTRLYVPDYGSNAIHVLDTTTMTETATLPFAGGPVSLAFTPDYQFLVAAQWDTDQVALVDPATGDVVSSASSGGKHPVSLLVRPDNVVLGLNYGSEPGETPDVKAVLAAFKYNPAPPPP